MPTRSVACLLSCAVDEDCVDGRVCDAGTCFLSQVDPEPSTGELVWITTFERPPGEDFMDVAIGGVFPDAAGGGTFLGSCSFPIRGLPCLEYNPPFLQNVDSEGVRRWGSSMGWRSYGPTAAAVSGTLAVGFTTNFSGGCCGASVRVYRPDGSEAWSRNFGGNESLLSDHRNLAIDPSGAVFAHFSTLGGVDYGGGPAPGSYLVKFNPAGQFLWQRPWALSDQVTMLGTAGGGLLVATDSDEAEDLGCQIPATPGSFYLAHLDATGACDWARVVGDPASYDVDVAATGQIVIAAISADPLDFGSGPVAPVTAAALFVATLDADGNEVWTTRFDSGGSTDTQVSIAATGEILLAGDFSQSVNFGGLTMVSDSGSSFIVKLAVDGSYRGQHQFGGGMVTAASDGGALIVGLGLDLNLGGGLVPERGGVAFAKIRL